jgi:hypothetical protein
VILTLPLSIATIESGQAAYHNQFAGIDAASLFKKIVESVEVKFVW